MKGEQVNSNTIYLFGDRTCAFILIPGPIPRWDGSSVDDCWRWPTATLTHGGAPTIAVSCSFPAGDNAVWSPREKCARITQPILSLFHRSSFYSTPLLQSRARRQESVKYVHYPLEHCVIYGEGCRLQLILYSVEMNLWSWFSGWIFILERTNGIIKDSIRSSSQFSLNLSWTVEDKIEFNTPNQRSVSIVLPPHGTRRKKFDSLVYELIDRRRRNAKYGVVNKEAYRGISFDTHRPFFISLPSLDISRPIECIIARVSNLSLAGQKCL